MITPNVILDSVFFIQKICQFISDKDTINDRAMDRGMNIEQQQLKDIWLWCAPHSLVIRGLCLIIFYSRFEENLTLDRQEHPKWLEMKINLLGGFFPKIWYLKHFTRQFHQTYCSDFWRVTEWMENYTSKSKWNNFSYFSIRYKNYFLYNIEKREQNILLRIKLLHYLINLYVLK